MVLSDADLNPYSLQSFKLYETRARFYLVGCDSNRTHWRVLKIDRSEPAELNINEDPVIYTQQECTKLLQTVAEGNRATGGLTMVTKAYGIIGFIKFLESYYMILVTKRRQIGTLCGHAVYAIDENQVITVPHSSVQTDLAHSKTELRYKKLLSSVDLTKDFFFSYTYKMMQSLQKNSLAGDTEGMPFGNMFVWNAFLTKGIRERLKNTLWIVALVHGYFEQAKISIYGHVFSLTLIARRSRHFAGTRYLKRGVNDKGRVANDVETEQIILDEDSGAKPGQMSSVVQNRGSIPLFWSQEASRLSPKPDIVLQRYDPFYEATRLHFEDLSVRYGDPIIILNLIKTVEKRPREMMLRREFANAVGYLNQILSEEKHLKFIHWDFHKFAKSKSANVLAVLGGVASEALDLTGIYYTGKWSNNKAKLQNQRRLSSSSNISMNHEREPQKRSSNGESVQNRPKGMTLQNGVLRTNCIDCLDRTNVAQYAYGLAALGRQLNAVGLTDVAKVDPDSSIAAALMEMYQNMGDALALQYGGSAAHNTVFPERQGRWKATTQSREFLKSIRRYYSNAYTDCDKQDAINLFLGYFHPEEGKPALWELDSDYYLHSRGEESPYETKLSKEATSSFNSNSLSRVPTYRDDFNRVKLTSFDKLLQVTCGSLKLLRVYSESEMKSGAGTTSGTAPDAAEVQLKSPNWLFGHRKHEHTELASSVISSNTHDKKEEQISNEFDFDWVSSLGILSEEDKYDRHSLTSATSEQEHWYGTELLPGLVSDSPANLHYAGLCEVKDISPFDFTSEEPSDHLVLNDENAIEVIATMQSAMDEYAKIGDDLGCRMTNVPLHANHADRISKWMFSGSTLS